MNESPEIVGKPKDPKAPLTQQQVEDFIMLAGQREERWFKICFIDEKMNEDSTALALMESLGDVIHAGIISLALEERMTQAKEDCKGVNTNGSH